jgi:hypothetical protein
LKYLAFGTPPLAATIHAQNSLGKNGNFGKTQATTRRGFFMFTQCGPK